MTIANIFDLIMLAVLIGVAIVYMRRGLVAGLVQFLGNLTSLVGAVLISSRGAPMLFSRFFESSFVEKLEAAIEAEKMVSVNQ
ncbi:membrane protein, partial [gut metagenome]